MPAARRARAWTIMQRIDHPDPAPPTRRRCDDLENGATGLSLVFAGSLERQRLGLDRAERSLARALDGVAARRRHCHRSQPQRRLAPHRPRRRRAGRRARQTPASDRSAFRLSIRSAASPHPRQSRRSLERDGAADFADVVARAGRRRLSAARSRSPTGASIHDAGGSEAQELAFALASRGRLSARARSRRHGARGGARRDLFPALGRRRPVSDHRQIPRAAKTVGARRDGLRPVRQSPHSSRRRRRGA